MSAAAAKRTVLAAVSTVALVVLCVVGPAGGAQQASRDRVPPTTPLNPHVVAATSSFVSLGWGAAQDNVGVAGYFVYSDTGRVTVARRAYVVKSLGCGRSAAVAVAAFDRAGNLSRRVTTMISTAACVDSQPPTLPSGVRQVATTRTAVVLAWDPSADSVGVVGYGVYRDLARVATTFEPKTSLSGLACGTTYRYSIDAIDAAGNRSALASAFVETSACLDSQSTGAPSNPPLVLRSTASPVSASEWVTVADEYESFTLAENKEVRYGRDNDWATTKVLGPGTYPCSNAFFGDPFPGTLKHCEARPTTGTPSASEWVPVANEYESFTLAQNKEVRYGKDDKWATSKVLGPGTYPCSNAFFGDPFHGTFKHCEARSTTGAPSTPPPPSGNPSPPSPPSPASPPSPPPPPPSGNPSPPSPPPPSSGWVTVANEYESFTLAQNKEVRYGKDNKWATSKVLGSGTYPCSNAFFGDPFPGTVKICETRSTTATPPPPPPPPAPPSPSGDTSPPSKPAGLTIATSGRNSVALKWNAATDNVGVMGYRAYVDGAPGATTTTTSATVSALACATAYAFEVDAHDAAGNTSAKSSVIGATAACVDTAAPSAPVNVVATSRTATSIALGWSASTDNVGVWGYGLYKSGTQVGTSPTTATIFSDLSCNTNYTIAVDAFDEAMNRSSTTTLMVATTECPDTTPPAVPTGLAASNVTQSSLTLRWDAAPGNAGVTGYDVLRNGTKMAYATGTSSSQTGLACGTSYTFSVVARDAAGNTSSPAVVQASTSACPPSPSSVWVTVANEYESFTLAQSKEVRYGKDNMWATSKVLGPGTYPCSNAFFGDPLLGTVKICEARSTSLTPLPSTPSPPSTPSLPPLPPSGSLLWPRPALTNPVTVQASNSNRVFNFSAGQDYIVRMPSTPLTTRGGLILNGGRNVVVIGGEIRQDVQHSGGESVALQYGIQSSGQTGTLHIEGLYIHGQGIGQALILAQGSGATVQVQNSRFESLHPVGDIHTDAIQSWAGPYIFRMYNVTLKSRALSLQMQPLEYYSGGFGQWHYERVNMEQMTAEAPGLNKSGGPWWAEYHKDLWFKPNPNHGHPIHVNWSYNPAGWNPGGNAGTISGEALKVGVPPGGDFVPASGVGLSYSG